MLVKWGMGRDMQEGRKACLPALLQLNKSFKDILIQALDQNDSFLSCNPYCFMYEIHINLGEWFRIFFFFLKNVKSFYQQIHRSKHLLDSHFCFPQRHASWLPLTCSFIFKGAFAGLVWSSQLHWSDWWLCKLSWVQRKSSSFIKSSEVIINSTAGGKLL